MANTISPNMNLLLPTVGSEPGPTYGFDQNASMTLIDQHDHSPGKGVAITPAGLNINTDVPFNNHSATDLMSLVLMQQSSAITTLDSLSVAPGSGTAINDLFFTDGSGNTIQITKSGAVNVVASSIPGETYSGGTFIWTQDQSGAPTTPANFDIGSITIRPNVPATTFGVTLSPNSGISSAYTINLPLLPVSTSFMTINSSGIMTNTIAVAGGITGSNIASTTITGSNIAAATITGSNIAATTITGGNLVNQTITSTQIANNAVGTNQIANTAVTKPKLAALGQQISTSSGTFSTSSTSRVDVTNLTLSITTTGRPVMIGMMADGTASHSAIRFNANTNTDIGTVFVMAGAVDLGIYDIKAETAGTNARAIYTPSSFNCISALSAGTYTIKIQVVVSNASDALDVNNTVLYAYEL